MALTRSLRVYVLSSLVAGMSCVILFGTGVMDGLVNFLSREGQGVESLTGRVPLWSESWTFITVHPLLGYGYESFWTSSHIDYFSEELHWAISAAHASYVEALLTLGAVGLLLQVLFLVFGLVQGVRLYRLSRSPLAALAACLCAAYLVVGVVESILVVKLSPYSFYLFLLLFALTFKEYSGASDPAAVPICGPGERTAC